MISSLQLGDAVADLGAVGLTGGFAGTAAADAAALPPLRPGQLGRLAQARRQVAQARDLDLRARRVGARVAVKDLEDHHGAVHHLAADLVLEVARLRRRDLVVHQHEIGPASCRCRPGPLRLHALRLRRGGRCVVRRLCPRALLRQVPPAVHRQIDPPHPAQSAVSPRACRCLSRPPNQNWRAFA